jgi:ribosomal protein L40E
MKLVQPEALALTPDGEWVVVTDASNTIRIITLSGSGSYDMATGLSRASCFICPAGTASKVAGSTICEACEANAYSPPGADTCTPCPRGAVCPNGIECSLRNQGISCTGEVDWAIVGTWVQDNSTNLFKLESCPAGHELINSLDALQECRKCGFSE